MSSEPPGQRSLVGSLSRFVVTGGLAVGTDVVLLFLLRSGAGLPVPVATAVAFAAGVVVNYTLNRNWTFRHRDGHGRAMRRYATVVALNLLSTELIVAGLTALGLFYLLSKLVAVAVNASLNFAAGRYWVFAAAAAAGTTPPAAPLTAGGTPSGAASPR